MSVAIQLQVRLFARLREQAGSDRLQLAVQPGASVADVYQALIESRPGVEPNRDLVRAALNQEFCGWEDRVDQGDEVAFIPPVSGGATAFVELTREPLDARRLEAAVLRPGAGAICTFTGVVRDSSKERAVSRLEYEAYPEMAESGMREIAAEIAQRWPEARVAMAHRVGRLEIGEASVVVSVSCPHRAQAFEACRWGIDRLKESVPIWKKEFAADGASWVEGDDLRPARPTT